jgi:hypothetical protein
MSYLTEYAKLVGLKKAPLAEGVDSEFVQQFKKMHARGRPMSVSDWTETMKQALTANSGDDDLTYNEFDLPKVSKALQAVPGISLAPAREYSVAIYVSGPQEALNKVFKLGKRLRADEVDFQEDGTLRLWWD